LYNNKYDAFVAKKNKIIVPGGAKTVLLHSCCAPCSTAIVEWLLNHGVTPAIFYYNPNIYPNEEYKIRKEENIRYAKSLDLKFVDADYNHEEWLYVAKPYKDEPEAGRRCLECFKERLKKTAEYAYNHEYKLFTTTLASSRWKNLGQINEAGRYATDFYPGVEFWAQNWRINGLTDRRNQLTKDNGFYQQQYCGCEFSLRDSNKWRKANGKPTVIVAGKK
jgi:epoxyqueuosine reductase